MPSRSTQRSTGRFGEPPKTLDSDAIFRAATPLALPRRSSIAAGEEERRWQSGANLSPTAPWRR